MKTLLTTMCAAASLSATPALAGVTPESFVSTFQHVVAAEAMEAETASGAIASIAVDKASFVLDTRDEKLLTVRVNEDTVYMLDGEKVDRDEALKIGRNATITHEVGLASRIEVSSKTGQL